MSEPPRRQGPLAGVRVIELAGIGPAPYACMLLADLGAEVLRLERFTRSPIHVHPPFDILARGRRSVAIDLKAPGATDLTLDLVREADVLVEANRPGVAERLGLGPDDCLAANERLVYARLTGWGQDGPLAQRAGHDIDYAAVAGALGMIGEPGRKPVPPLNLVADFGGGSMFCVMGILAALVERGVSGKGQVVDVAMVDGVTSLLTMAYSQRGAGELVEERGQNMLDGGMPYYDTYRCSDDEYMAVGPIEPQFYAELVRVLDLPDLPSQDEVAAWPRIRDQLTEAFAQRTRAEWTAAFDGTDACVSPVWRLGEVADDPHVKARRSLVEVDGVLQPAVAPRFSRTPGAVGVASTEPGADTRDALADWGVSAERLSRLLADDVVRQA